MDGNNLKSSYAQGVESQVAKKAQTTATYGSGINTAQALEAGASAGHSMIGADQGAIKALKDYGADGLQKAARASTVARTASTLGAIEGAGGEQQYIDDQATGAKASARATRRDIAKAGGSDSYVKRAGIMAEVKSAQMNQDVAAMQEYGMVSNQGSVTNLGDAAFGVAAHEKHGAMSQKVEAFKNFNREDFKKRAVESYMLKHGLDSNNSEHAKQANDAVEKGMNEVGLIAGASPQQVAGAIAGLGATNFSASRSVNFMGMNMNMGLSHDGSTRIDSSVGEQTAKNNLTSTTEGTKTDFYNDQVNLHNTAAPTNAALGLKDGNLKEAANLMKSRDAADHWSNPKNWGTMGTAWIADTFFGGDQEAAVAAASGAGGMFASGVLLASLEKATVDKNGHMQLDKKDLKAFDSKADGYYDGGVKVADADGYALDAEGNRAVDHNRKGKGVVRRGAGAVAEGVSATFQNTIEALRGKTSIDAPDSTPDGSTQQDYTPEHKGSKNISTHTKTSSVDFSSGNFTQIPTRAQVGSFSGIGSPPMPSALDLKTYQQVPLSDVPGSIGHTGKDATLHGKGGGGRLLGKALGVAGVALVGSELHAATKDNITEGNYGQAAVDGGFVVAEAFDPTFFGVQTARQQGTIAAEQIKGGQYKEAAATVAQTPKVFAENAYKTGEALRQEYDNYSSIAENLHREIHGTPKNEFIGSGLNLQQALKQTPLQEAVAKVDGNALIEEQERMQKEQRSLNVENNVMETKTRSDQALGAIEDMAQKLEETQTQLKEVSRKRIIVPATFHKTQTTTAVFFYHWL